MYESFSNATPIISGFFNVYIDEDRDWLIYIKKECEHDDTQPGFLLHLTPRDINDLPEPRRQFGFDNFDFGFTNHGLRFDNKCVIQFNLPDYDIIGIRTGQYARVGDALPPIWIQEALTAPIDQSEQ